MKNIFIIFVFAVFSTLCLGQKNTKKTELWRKNGIDSIEQKRLMNLTQRRIIKAFDVRISDIQDDINHPSKAPLLNNQYVRSYIGINLDTISKLSDSWPLDFKKAPADSLFIYQGKRFGSFENYVCPSYNPMLISLWDIKKVYAKGIPIDKCLFMVDDYLLTTDLDGFKFDNSYIDKIIVTSPKEIQSLEKGKYLDLYLVHIFTKSKKVKNRKALSFSTANGKVVYLNSHDYRDVNYSNKLFFLNSTNVKSFIGIDIDSLKKEEGKGLVIELSPLSYETTLEKNKCSFDTKLNIVCEKYKPKFISLQEIAKKFFPTEKADFHSSRCIFFINDILITSDLVDLKIDIDYIYMTRLFQSSELECLGGGIHTDLSVIRIYVKDQETLKKSKPFVTYGDLDVLKSY